MKIIIRVIFYLIGLLFLTLGISLAIKAELGASAWDALAVGESKTFGLSVGNWIIINSSVLLFVNAFLQKKRPDWLAAITFILIGRFLDFWLTVESEYLFDSNIVTRYIQLVLAILSMTIGIAIYLQAKFPLSPIDDLMISLNKRFGVSLGVAKTIGEVFALVLAFLLQGPIGIGTVLITFSIGPILQRLRGPVEKLYIRLSS
ncbi:membrane protein [Bacillus sp. AFS055030]|uniref:YczE/YyaS/YitT family protein n=1 Tax=Bacillus sp. AFS055030 TaxID=2033507 RepID=UPI002570A7F2|nr:membrane protein [Bacillus sp. AFS055030]